MTHFGRDAVPLNIQYSIIILQSSAVCLIQNYFFAFCII